MIYLEAIGKVVSIEGIMAEVTVKRTTACGGDCGKCGGCAQTQITIKAINEENAGVGEIVKVVPVEDNFLLLVFYVFIFPLISMLVSYISVYSYITSRNISGNAELLAMAAGFVGMALSYLILRYIGVHLEKRNKLGMRIKKLNNYISTEIY